MTPGPYRTPGAIAQALDAVRCAGCSTAIEREVVCFSDQGHTVCQGCFRLECATAAANELRLPRVHPTWRAGRFMCGLFLCLAGPHVILPGPAYVFFAIGAFGLWGISRSTRI
jgi:hypothetical protein